MPRSIELSESPFVDVQSFEIPTGPTAKRPGLSSPFVEAFTFEHTDAGAGGPTGAARRILVAELYDEELDNAMYELIGEAAYASNGNGSKLGESSLRLHFSPLANEIEAFIQRAAD